MIQYNPAVVPQSIIGVPQNVDKSDINVYLVHSRSSLLCRINYLMLLEHLS